MLYDFHTHTFLSDGELSPIELVRRAVTQGYTAIALTDHVGLSSLNRVVPEIVEECALARAHWDILAIPGVELTHLPPAAIAEAAERAKQLGAWLVVVHGETIVEPVPPGTNLAALTCPWVDILAHPGLLTAQEAQLAASKGTFLELSARKGHCLTNGHVARLARQSGARLITDSDAHQVSDLLTLTLARAIAQGAGLQEAELNQILTLNPQALLERLSLARK